LKIEASKLDLHS